MLINGIRVAFSQVTHLKIQGNVKSYMKNKPQRTQSAQSNVKKSKEKDRAAKRETVLWALL